MIRFFEYALLFYFVYTIVRLLLRPINKNGQQRPGNYRQGNYDGGSHSAKKNGETFISGRPQNKPRQDSDDDGEYIDYKEVD
jgi:hypothetical protein